MNILWCGALQAWVLGVRLCSAHAAAACSEVQDSRVAQALVSGTALGCTPLAEIPQTAWVQSSCTVLATCTLTVPHLGRLHIIWVLAIHFPMSRARDCVHNSSSAAAACGMPRSFTHDVPVCWCTGCPSAPAARSQRWTHMTACEWGYVWGTIISVAQWHQVCVQCSTLSKGALKRGKALSAARRIHAATVWLLIDTLGALTVCHRCRGVDDVAVSVPWPSQHDHVPFLPVRESKGRSPVVARRNSKHARLTVASAAVPSSMYCTSPGLVPHLVWTTCLPAGSGPTGGCA